MQDKGEWVMIGISAMALYKKSNRKPSTITNQDGQ
jgi:hypothetical protein